MWAKGQGGTMKRADRKALVQSILVPYLTAKKDLTIITQYDRVMTPIHGSRLSHFMAGI